MPRWRHTFALILPRRRCRAELLFRTRNLFFLLLRARTAAPLFSLSRAAAFGLNFKFLDFTRIADAKRNGSSSAMIMELNNFNQLPGKLGNREAFCNEISMLLDMELRQIKYYF